MPQSVESLKAGAAASQMSKSSRAEQSMQSNKAPSSRKRRGDNTIVNENKELNVVVNHETTSIPETETAN